MFDLLIINANPYLHEKGADIAIANGIIAEIAPNIPESSAAEVIDAGGRFVGPGFVDSHTHFDKALTMSDKESCDLIEAIASYAAYCDSFSEQALAEDITRRASKIARMVAVNGTTSVRTHSNMDVNTRMASIEALNQLKKDVKGFLDMQISVLPNYYPIPEKREKTFERLEYVCSHHLIDYIGGSPFFDTHEQNEKNMDRIFALSEKYGIPIDVHVDESDEPDVHCLEYMADMTIRHSMQGCVSCGHCTAMNAVDESTAERVIEKCKKAELNIITLPSCNLFLMGRRDKQPVRRGLTTVKEFHAAGVNVSFASDNIRDPFRPYGNGDMLEECLLTVQVLQMALKDEIDTVYRMGTYNPAKALMLPDYGLEKGKRADLVLFDAETLPDAIISQSAKLAVIKNGRVIARSRKENVFLG